MLTRIERRKEERKYLKSYDHTRKWAGKEIREALECPTLLRSGSEDLLRKLAALAAIPTARRCRLCGGLCCRTEFGWDPTFAVKLDDEDFLQGWGGPNLEPLCEGKASIPAKDGRCVHNVDGRCTIYKERPYHCRYFDCTVFLYQNLHGKQVPAAINKVYQRVFKES